MEVKINKEIRNYSESMFFGLTLRQFFFSALGIVSAVGVFFLCRDALGLEITTWICVLVVVPFGAAGFVTYNGMPAEKFAAAVIKSRLVYPSKYLAVPRSFYFDEMKESIGIRQGSLTAKELKRIKKRDLKAERKALREENSERRGRRK